MDGQIVHLDQPKIQFFRSLAYTPFVDVNGAPVKGSGALNQGAGGHGHGHGNAPVELSGTINLQQNGELELVSIQFGDLMGTQLPKGALTFHTHTVPPGTSNEINMSTDVPSPVDLASIAMSIVFHGAREHLVFTPHYVYTITLYKEYFDTLQQQASRMASSELERQTSTALDKSYQELIQKHGQNFGSGFVRDWLDWVQRQGYNIHRFDPGQNVSFAYGPFKRMQDDMTWDNRASMASALMNQFDSHEDVLWWDKTKLLLFIGGAALFAGTMLHRDRMARLNNNLIKAN
jgi:hypothetical protein